MDEIKRTEIKEVGEFGLIEQITKNFKNQHESTIVGVGDDAAVIDCGEKYLLLSTDMLLENVHFDLSYVPLAHLGYKAISVNVSDIVAMNGIPRQVVVSLGLSNRFSVEAIEKLYEGIQYACEDFKLDLVGGDTTSSQSGLVISVSITGEVEKEKLTLRKGARENDILCVTGDVGAAYMGLQVLAREKQVFISNPNMKPELEKYNYLVERQLKPIARTDTLYELRKLGVVPTSMIDVSDGIASELYHLSKNSGVGFTVYEDKIPVDKQTYDTSVEFNVGPITSAMNGGEDYELLFTVKQSDFEKLEKHPDIHFIGHVTNKKDGLKLMTKSGDAIEILAQGFRHF